MTRLNNVKLLRNVDVDGLYMCTQHAHAESRLQNRLAKLQLASPTLLASSPAPHSPFE